MTTVILFIVILGILVLAHEFGHFITARKLGIKTYEFGFGYPPRAFGFYRDPNTKKIVFVWGKGKSSLKKTVSGDENVRDEFPAMLWSFNWLPIGGFVRIKGENGENANEPDSFGFHKAWKRILVLVAGVSMNFILAGIILSLGFIIGLPTDLSQGIDKYAKIVEPASVIIQQVQSGTPAQESGLQFGDKILKLDDTEIKNIAAMNEYIDSKNGEAVVVSLLRGEESLNVSVTPRILEGGQDADIGVAIAEAGLIAYPWYIALYKGFAAAVFGTINIFIAFYYLLKNLILGQGLLFEVAGPVGIASIVGQSARLGFNYILNVTAMLSLSLAVINILPIPALDGGRVLFIIIEKIIRRPVSMKYEQLAHTIGFVLLMGLVVVVTWRDIVGLF